MLPTKVNKMERWLYQETSDDNLELPILSKQKLHLLESANFLSTSEKQELLLILLNYQFASELDLNNKVKKIKLLKALSLQHFINSRIHSSKGEIKWIQVSANKKIHQFVKKYSDSMSAFTAGLLYGYPPTAILAFQNLIPRQTKLSGNSFMKYWFSMVRSRHWFKEEQKYFENIGNLISKTSPKLYKEMQRIHSRKN